MDPETQAILNFLRASIRVLGLTHQDVARRLGISRSTLGRLLSGKKELRLADVIRICQSLDIETEEVLLVASLRSRTDRWLTQLRAN